MPPTSASARSPTRILVTGGTGFIGRHALQPLLDAGYDVQLVAPESSAVPDGVTLHLADLLEPGAAESMVEELRPAELLHMAWFVVPGQVWNAIENVRWAEASLSLLRAFGAAGGRRALITGTCSEYAPNDQPCREAETPLEPTTLYGASKDAVRRVGELIARECGFGLAWPRIFLAFGPHEHPARLVASITRNLLLGRPAPCSHGRQLRDFLYTPDIGEAIVAVLRSDVTGPINVASGRPVTLREIIEHLGRSVGRPELIRFGEVTPPAHEAQVLTADVTRLHEEVAWRPAHSLQEGLDATIAWWRAQLMVHAAE